MMEGNPAGLLGALRSLSELDAVRLLFLGNYAGPDAGGLCSLVLVATLKSMVPLTVRLLRGGVREWIRMQCGHCEYGWWQRTERMVRSWL